MEKKGTCTHRSVGWLSEELQLASRSAGGQRTPADTRTCSRAQLAAQAMCERGPLLPNRRAKEMHVPCFSTSRTSPSSASELPCPAHACRRR